MPDISWDISLRGHEHVSYRIGIIGGDGIGPEVVDEAMKVVDAAGVDYEAVPFDLQRKLIDDYSKTAKEEFA